MDVVYTNTDWIDQGVLDFDKFDLGYGSDENSFDIEMSLQENQRLEEGCQVYIPGTEYGGLIDSISTDTGNATVKYSGRTWHGVLEGKVISPPSNQAYRTVTGDANAVLRQLVSLMGLGSLFSVSTESSGITISYTFSDPRYVTGYTAIRKMLLAHNAKLKIEKRTRVVLCAEPIDDYSDSEYDENNADFKIEENKRPINHIVCLGMGELTKRTVIHIYADESGNVSRNQTLFGVDEVAEVYDYNNAEDDDLLSSGTSRLKDYQDERYSMEITLTEEEDLYDIDDVVGARSIYVDTAVFPHITKKIVRITDVMDVEYVAGAAFSKLNSTGEFPLNIGGNKTFISSTDPTEEA